VTGVGRDEAQAAIVAAGGKVRTAIVMLRTGTTLEEAERLLAEHDYHLRPLLGDPPPVTGS
jgi:N-acetylmuramic acid 6-phosphate etherase